MKWPLRNAFAAWRARKTLPEAARQRIARMRRPLRGRREALRARRAERLATARFVCMDLETTGPRMLHDRIISIGAVAVRQRMVLHAEAFEAIVRQPRASLTENILVHQIGGQDQLAGHDPAAVLLDFLEFLSDSVAVAYRAEFDEAMLSREARACLGLCTHPRFLDLASLLPGLFPGLENDSLDDWVAHFSLPPIERHHAVADAYTNGQLLLLVLDQAQRVQLETVGDLLDLQRAHRWLGLRH